MGVVGPRLTELNGKTIQSCVQADVGTLIITFTDTSILLIDVRTALVSGGGFCAEAEFCILGSQLANPQLIIFGDKEL